MNCWEYMKCGREANGINSDKLGVCPAYPSGGKNCARVAGTLCGGRIQGTFATKLTSCMKCNYYRSDHYDRNYGALSSNKPLGSTIAKPLGQTMRRPESGPHSDDKGKTCP